MEVESDFGDKCSANGMETNCIDNSESGLMKSLNVHVSPESGPPAAAIGHFPWDLQCPLEEMSFWKAMYDRVSWLIGLLLFQSCSSYILAENVELLQKHPAIIFYLTMLVGAGGNAGNQASVRIIRGMALGLITDKTRTKILLRECVMGLAICFVLSLVGLIRVLVSAHTTTSESIAITVSLTTIVFFSIVIGSLLPFFLLYLKFDPMHASTSIQVIMDISGVLITCLVSSVILRGADLSVA